VGAETGVSTDIPIITGDPGGEKAASFTRFVLPFGYQPTLFPAAPPDAVFCEKTDPAEAFSRQYLTFETSAVLYERARWLVLKRPRQAPVNRRFTLWRAERPIAVELAPPRMVLFEWPKRPGVEAVSEGDALRTGFLLLYAEKFQHLAALERESAATSCRDHHAHRFLWPFSRRLRVRPWEEGSERIKQPRC